MKILGLSGSLRRESHNSALLEIAGGLLPAGAELEVFEGLRYVEPYDADLDGERAPAGATRFRTALGRADALLIATPEYNSSVPGVLKNAIDWASRPLGESALTGMPAAVIGASTGRFGAIWSQAEVRKILAASGARVVEGELAIGRAADAFDADGLRDPEAAERLRSLLDVLRAEAAPRVAVAA